MPQMIVKLTTTLLTTAFLVFSIPAANASQQKRPDGAGGGNVTAKYDLVKAKGARIINTAGKPGTANGAALHGSAGQSHH